MMWVVIMLLPSLAFTTVKAQDTLVLDIEKALEIALSENPIVKVANKDCLLYTSPSPRDRG